MSRHMAGGRAQWWRGVAQRVSGGVARWPVQLLALGLVAASLVSVNLVARAGMEPSEVVPGPTETVTTPGPTRTVPGATETVSAPGSTVRVTEPGTTATATATATVTRTQTITRTQTVTKTVTPTATPSPSCTRHKPHGHCHWPWTKHCCQH